jgi:hypothetical protein
MWLSSKNRSRPHLYRQPAEQPLRAALIGFNLRPQSIHVIEAALIPQTQNEA